MSTHDRGAFGQLLAEAKERGASRVYFVAELNAGSEDEMRWRAVAETTASVVRLECYHIDDGHGRTGEEALRRLVEAMRGTTSG